MLQKADTSIVFVYLGNALPSHLPYAIKQAKEFNPLCDIYLISDDSCLIKSELALNELNVKLITCNSLDKSGMHNTFDEIYARHMEDFGVNIEHFLKWKWSIERFFYIHEFMEKYQLRDVVQIECDVMIYIDLERNLNIFQKYYPEIACSFQNDNLASLSIVYFSNSTSIEKFLEFILFYSKGRYISCDMDLLAAYRNFSSNRVEQLPTLTKESMMFSAIKSQAGDVPSQAWKYWNHIEEWDSIFDNDNLSLYLEMKQWGAPRIIFNPDAYTFSWEKDCESRWIPYAREKTTLLKHKYRINTLHIHHKGGIAKFLSSNALSPT